MARFLKFKFLIISKLNFNGCQFYKKTLNFDYFKKLSKLHWIKVWNRNVDFVRQKLWVENFESKILSDFKLNKPLMARFLKFKFLFIYKLNFKRGQFYKKTLNFDYFKK